MDVIRHKAVAEQGEVMEPAIMLNQLQVDQAAGIGVEDEPARISALGDMMRRIDCDNAGQASHR